MFVVRKTIVVGVHVVYKKTLHLSYKYLYSGAFLFDITHHSNYPAQPSKNKIPTMQDTFKCTQCSEVFISKSARKSHVRNCHQTIVKLTDSHGNIIQIEKINNVFSCPASTCQYSTDNAALMQSHYSRCRFRIRKSIPQVPHNPNNVFIPNRVPPAGDEIEGESLSNIGCFILTH